LSLPTDAQARKDVPLSTFIRKYFPDALVELAAMSRAQNDRHNPGSPMHWSRDVSNDHEDCLMRHHMESGTIDEDGWRHSIKVAWRALAVAQLEIEQERETAKVKDFPG
jgi:hypothetical protein